MEYPPVVWAILALMTTMMTSQICCGCHTTSGAAYCALAGMLVHNLPLLHQQPYVWTIMDRNKTTRHTNLDTRVCHTGRSKIVMAIIARKDIARKCSVVIFKYDL
jgi:hypothetical protein